MPPKSRRPRNKKSNRKVGSANNNTKTQLHAVYKQDSAWSIGTSPNPAVGSYGYTTYSPFNSSTQNVTQSPEFQTQALMYDEFCIHKVKVVYTPVASQSTSANWQTSVGTNFMMYTVIDRDGQLPVSTATNVPTKLETYDSFKRYHLTKSFSRTLVCKKYWIDTGLTSGIDPRSESGLAQQFTNAGVCQILALYAQNLPITAGIQIATVRLQWYVSFRGKKAVSYTVLPDGKSIVMTPIEAFNVDITPFNVPNPLEKPIYENIVECVEGVVQVRSLRDDSIVPVPE